MAFIDISKLERNGATKPFHIAAGIEAFANDPWQLSENECLLYQIHQERPDTFLKTAGEAQGFLKTFEPNQARTIQKRAEAMCGIGRLLSEGSKVELRIDGKQKSFDVSPYTYSHFYSNNPVASKEELARGVERTL